MINSACTRSLMRQVGLFARRRRPCNQPRCTSPQGSRFRSKTTQAHSADSIKNKGPNYQNRLKVETISVQQALRDWHSKLGPTQREMLGWTAGAILTAVAFFNSSEYIPTGSVGISHDAITDETCLIPPSWQLIGSRLYNWLSPSWWSQTHLFSQIHIWSIRQNHTTFRTRVADAQGNKVFVTILLQYQLVDPVTFLRPYYCNNKKLQQHQQKEDEQEATPVFPHSKSVVDNERFLQSFLVEKAKKELAKLFGSDNTVQRLYTRKLTTHDLGISLAKQMNDNLNPVGIHILQTTIVDLELSYKLNKEVNRIHHEMASRKYEIGKWKKHIEKIQEKSDQHVRQIAASVMGGTKKDNKEEDKKPPTDSGSGGTGGSN